MPRRKSKYIHDSGCDVTTHDAGVCLCTPPYPILRPMVIQEHHKIPSLTYKVMVDGHNMDTLETLQEAEAVHRASFCKRQDPKYRVEVLIDRVTFFRVEYNRAWADHGRVIVMEATCIADAAHLPDLPLITQMGIVVNKVIPLTYYDAALLAAAEESA